MTMKALVLLADRWGVAGVMLVIFLLAYMFPFGAIGGDSTLVSATRESLLLVQDYARHHVLLCLVPAFFIAGAISVFVSQAAVIKYFGAHARKVVAYSVASVSGTILAVCSCTILPLFAGIYSRGAGLGPAIAFLYAGPAINVLAIIMTARVLGWQLGLARALGAVVISVVIGLLMHTIYLKEERAKASEGDFVVPEEENGRPLWMNAAYFAVMIGILVFANWGKPAEAAGPWHGIWSVKWIITGVLLVVLGLMLARWFSRQDLKEWTSSTWVFARKILPLLLLGVLVAGFLLGRPGHPALIPQRWVTLAVGGNSVWSNVAASVAGAFMYFATLTEVPILESLLGAGMGKGPALALLLAGPALSLPNMLVIRSVIGTRKTLVYVVLVVVFSASGGMIYGRLG
jgi:uncharacterized membrane protein YraQ (UPF0718 family)